MARILVVDDDVDLQKVLRRSLAGSDREVIGALSGEEAIRLAGQSPPDLAVIDLKLPGVDGLGCFKKLRERHSRLIGIVLTGYPSYPSVIDALRCGIADYLEKPFRSWQPVGAIDRALGASSGAGGDLVDSVNRSVSRQPTVPSASTRGPFPGFDDIVGDCPEMRDVFRLIPRVAASVDPVVIIGETGTGKELVARAIHRHSTRWRAPFVDLNCAAIPLGLFESELFGHERGAFTDARDAKPGKFEVARRGTLFFDEIGELPVEAQAKLLRVIETRQVTRLGAVTTTEVDVRLIAATNADLELLAGRGVFRRDLFYRLNVLTVLLPPLRQRSGDLELLIDHFLDRVSLDNGVNITLTARARQVLLRHDWPGNVRELDHRLRQAVTFAAGTALDVGDLRLSISTKGPPAPTLDLPEGFNLTTAGARVLADFEASHIQAALDRHGGNQTAAALDLGIDRRTLYSKMHEYKIIGLVARC